MPDEIIVIQRNHFGEETWRYTGKVIWRNGNGVLIEAPFNRDDLPFHGLVFKRCDRFVELYLRGHWFNIFEIHDRDTDAVKAWYCNITRPPLIQDGQIVYDDLALDLLVYVDGRQLVLDKDEFERLGLSVEDQTNAWNGLKELQTKLKNPAQFSFDALLGRD